MGGIQSTGPDRIPSGAQVRREDRQREDARRWDADRIDAYTILWGESLTLTTRLRDLSPYRERDEEPPPEMMLAFEDQRDLIAKAHARAMLLASKPVKTALVSVWQKTTEIGTALDHPADGSKTGDERSLRLSRELGSLLGHFNEAAKTELGIDPDA